LACVPQGVFLTKRDLSDYVAQNPTERMEEEPLAQLCFFGIWIWVRLRKVSIPSLFLPDAKASSRARSF
jgi:hypothetical protein